MRIFRDTVCKQQRARVSKYGAQKEFMWCFHFTKIKIIDVRVDVCEISRQIPENIQIVKNRKVDLMPYRNV